MIRDLIAGYRRWQAERAYHRIELLQRKAAKLEGDAAFHKRMADFYTAQVDKIDPNVKWHEFAALKDKEQVQIEEHRNTTMAMLETEAEYAARLEQYEKGEL